MKPYSICATYKIYQLGRKFTGSTLCQITAGGVHTREIGIRMALGAQPKSILKLIAGRGLVLVSVGVVIGVLASFGLTRFIENMLFGVTPADPLTFVMNRSVAWLRRTPRLPHSGPTGDASRSNRRAKESVNLFGVRRLDAALASISANDNKAASSRRTPKRRTSQKPLK